MADTSHHQLDAEPQLASRQRIAPARLSFRFHRRTPDPVSSPTSVGPQTRTVINYRKEDTVSTKPSPRGNIVVLPQPKLCPHCPAKFIRTTHLNRHLRTHTGDRPYRCDTCDALFTRSDLLTRHKRTCVDLCFANFTRQAVAGSTRVKSGRPDPRDVKPYRTISTRPSVVSTLLYLHGERLISGLEDGSLQINKLTTDSGVHRPYYSSSGQGTSGFNFAKFPWWNRGSTVRDWGPTVAIDKTAIVTGGRDGTLSIFDTEEKVYIAETKSNYGQVHSIAISPGHGLLGTSHEGVTVVWKLTKTRKTVYSITGRRSFKTKYLLKARYSVETNQAAGCLAFAPDGKKLAAGYANGSIHVFDTDTGDRLPLAIEGHAGTVSSLLWSLDGSLLISGSHDHTILCWSAQTGNPLRVGHFPASRARVMHLALSPDGKKLASASYDGTVTFWDMDTCAPLERRLFHTRTVWTLAFSLSGEFVACGQDDGEISVWRVPWAESGNREGITLADGTLTDSQIPLEESQGPLLDLTGRITRDGDGLAASGTYACVYTGLLLGHSAPIKVAIKVIKAEGNDLKRKQKRLLREIKIASSLDHPNVLPFLGTARGFGQLPALISPWADHGTLTSYLELAYEDLSVLDVLTLLSDVASALHYLHSCSIVHGDLSGSNVLIPADKRARIADFGLSMFLSESAYASSCPAGTLRWTAPELLDPHVPEDGTPAPKVVPTQESDVYSLGGLMLQILSGKVPYYYLPRDGQVVKAIIEGRTPARPTHHWVTDRRWSLIQRCWTSVQTRPSSAQIVHFAEMELSENSENQNRTRR